MLPPELDPNKLGDLDLEHAESALSNIVYEATQLVEKLEMAGLVRGNGHHIRQNIARFAMEELRKHWKPESQGVPASPA